MRNLSALCVVLLAGCAHAPATPPVQAPATTSATATAPTGSATVWQRHDPNRPQPRIARPATAVALRAPADATILFDGTNLDAWRSENGTTADWTVRDGVLEVAGKDAIRTTSSFGDVQLHFEWSTPLPPQGEGEERGNSGVVLMGRYEVQVLDSYGNNAVADAQAGAIYGQSPPLVNASLPPGEWQSFDIIFHAAHYQNGQMIRPARITVFQNGVLVQDDVALTEPTSDANAGGNALESLPLVLQNGGQPVRYRNIWIRDLNQGE